MHNRRSRAEQQAQLNETYRSALAADLGELQEAVDQLSGCPTAFVGSGGAFAVAQLAADSFERRFRVMSRAMTPLMFAGLPSNLPPALVLFSSGGRNPDARLTLRWAQRRGVNPVVLVTHHGDAPKPNRTSGHKVLLVKLPWESPKDGFLATNSVLHMATLWVRALGYDEALGRQLPIRETRSFDRKQCLILTAPGLNAVAVDLETRLAELGLAAAQVTDYRNFAHGRHFGLSRNLDETTIVALIDPSSEKLANSTLDRLPAKAEVLRLESKAPWPMGVIELLSESISIASAIAERNGVRPDRPGVPSFGRQIYHLRYERSLRDAPTDSVLRKTIAAGVPESDTEVRSRYLKALESWLNRMAGESFGGLVLDYDGTVCATHQRWDLPRTDVQKELQRLISSGILVGFASGRGGSLWEDLRKWLPRELWERVYLGPYSGGINLKLSDHWPERTVQRHELEEALDLVRGDVLSERLDVRSGHSQLRVTPRAGSGISVKALAAHLTALLGQSTEPKCRALASGHSVDVVPIDSSKCRIVEELRKAASSSVLIVGDQGQPGGNDFELLASSFSSLTVDRCSSDPTRCWNLGGQGESGPALLVRYLRAIRLEDDRATFTWSWT